VETAYRDCCNYGGGDPGWLNFCKETEASVVTARNAGQTHFLEEYCKTRWKFGVGSVCVQRARSYCVFNSKLGRIIQEQGRQQLKAFQPGGAWGNHSDPNCRGLSPQEFQMIDFSKVDLSEFVSSINTTVSTQVQQQMSDSVNRFFNNMQQ
jgi:conjugal transfer mating pair stabilization protein TraN